MADNSVTVNGRTYDLNNQSDRADLRTQGYFVGSDSSGNVYAQPGFANGQADQPTGASSGGSGGGGSAVSGAVSSSLQPLVDAFGQGSGFSVQQLQEQKREFDAQMAFAQQQMQAIGIPQEQIQQMLANANVQFQQAATALAQRQEQFTEAMNNAQLTGDYNGVPTLEDRQFAAQQALNDAGVTGVYGGQATLAGREFGAQQDLAAQEATAQNALNQANVTGFYNGSPTLAYLAQEAQFAASNPFQLSDFLRGSQTGGSTTPQYLQNLQNGVAQGATGTPTAGAAAPQAVRMGDLGTPYQGPAPTFTNNFNANPYGPAGAPSSFQSDPYSGQNAASMGQFGLGTNGPTQLPSASTVNGQNMLGTPVSPTMAQAVAQQFPEGTFVKDPNSALMGVVRNGQFTPFSSWQQYVQAGGPVDPSNPNVANFNSPLVKTATPQQMVQLLNDLPNSAQAPTQSPGATYNTQLPLPSAPVQTSKPSVPQQPGGQSANMAIPNYGSADWTQWWNQAMGGTPTFSAAAPAPGMVSALGGSSIGPTSGQTGGSMASNPYASAGMSVGGSYGGSANNAGYNPNTGGFNQTGSAANAISNIYQKGPNSLGLGTLESLTPDELNNFQQGVNQQYGSAAGPAFLNTYRSNPVRSQQAATTGYYSY